MAPIKRLGKQTVTLTDPPKLAAAASVAGPKEGEGPLRAAFDVILEDDLWGEKTWEKAESKMIREVFAMLLSKSSKGASDIHYILAGDLLNQCIASSF
jgi:stage V sporulation protein AD